MTAIEDFLAQKSLSVNSRQAYAYDLEQFRQLVGGQIDTLQLQRYQQEISRFKIAVQQRKLSAVNQFLAYLYETDQLKTFHRLKRPQAAPAPNQPVRHQSPIVASDLEGDRTEKSGQLLALLIFHLGLQPSELINLEVSAINLPFGVLTVERGGHVRVLRLPKELETYLLPFMTGTYLFDKGGKPYSRQWHFNHLRAFLREIGRSDLSAQGLRDVFILNELDQGRSLSDLANHLGLQGLASLERYHKS